MSWSKRHHPRIDSLREQVYQFVVRGEHRCPHFAQPTEWACSIDLRHRHNHQGDRRARELVFEEGRLERRLVGGYAHYRQARHAVPEGVQHLLL